MLGKESNKCFPEFYHIGCLKTGTTSIQMNLEKDKRINVIRSRYFNNNFWYTDQYNYFEKGKVNIESDENIIIDYDKFSGFITSIERISRVRPDAKIIVTIREQRDLLISAYRHHIITHKFSGSLEIFLNSSAGKRYITMVHYDNIYRVLSTYFNKSNVYILFFEELKENYILFYKKIYKILNLSFPEKIDNIKRNTSYPDQFYLMLSRLLKFKLFSNNSILSGLDNKFWDNIIKYLKSYYKNKIYNQEIKWGNNIFFKNLNEDFRHSNNKLIGLIDCKLDKLGYLV